MGFVNTKKYTSGRIKYDVVNFDYHSAGYVSISELNEEFERYINKNEIKNPLCIYFKEVKEVNSREVFGFAKKVAASGIERVAIVDPVGEVRTVLNSFRDLRDKFRFVPNLKEL